MRIPIPSFVSGGSSSSNEAFDPSNSINLYVEKGSDGAKNSLVLLHAPGKLRICNLSNNGANRRLYVTGTGRVFSVCESTVFEILSNGTFVRRGIIETTSGTVGMSDSEIQLIIVDGFKGYLLDLATNIITVISNPDFPNGTLQVCFLNQKFICPVPNTGFFRWSAVLDGGSWYAFDEASAEALSDILVACVTVQGQVWALGTRTKEVFYDTGGDAAGNFVFDRVPGSVSDHGCASPFSPQVIGSNLFMVGYENGGSIGVFASSGYDMTKVSDPKRDADIATWTDKDFVSGLYYEQNAHAYYEISSVAGKRTWSYDLKTGLWAQKMSRTPLGEEGRDIAQFHVFAFGKNIIGDYRNGRIYELSSQVYTEDGEIWIKERTGGSFSSNGKRVFLTRFGIDFQPGVGLGNTTNSNADPQAIFSVSRNGGATFGIERMKSIGKVGQYAKQTSWSRLGWSYNFVPRVRISAAVPVAIMDAWADVEVQA